jgi:hypothetical protein
MLISSGLVSAPPQLDLYACTDFPLVVRFLGEPQFDFGISIVSKDTSSVEKNN